MDASFSNKNKQEMDMTGTENIRCAIRFQKEKHIYAELPRNTKRFLKDGLQIQVLEEKEETAGSESFL